MVAARSPLLAPTPTKARATVAPGMAASVDKGRTDQGTNRRRHGAGKRAVIRIAVHRLPEVVRPRSGQPPACGAGGGAFARARPRRCWRAQARPRDAPTRDRAPARSVHAAP